MKTGEYLYYCLIPRFLSKLYSDYKEVTHHSYNNSFTSRDRHFTCTEANSSLVELYFLSSAWTWLESGTTLSTGVYPTYNYSVSQEPPSHRTLTRTRNGDWCTAATGLVAVSWLASIVIIPKQELNFPFEQLILELTFRSEESLFAGRMSQRYNIGAIGERKDLRSPLNRTWF